jgi:hypothetical protein
MAFILQNENEMAQAVPLRDVGALVYLESWELTESEDGICPMLVKILIKLVLTDWDKQIFDLPCVNHISKNFFEIFHINLIKKAQF